MKERPIAADLEQRR
jgi:antitoxin HigA-1